MDFHGKKVAQSGTLIKSGVDMVNYIGTNKKKKIRFIQSDYSSTLFTICVLIKSLEGKDAS